MTGHSKGAAKAPKTQTRENFSPATKEQLKERAGNACSFVDCHIPTSGPSDESPVQTASTGVAAHICAASRGPGARRRMLDSSYDRRKLRDYGNGIWMCSNHAKLIDTDEVRFTVEILHRWRELAELRAALQHAVKKPVTLHLREGNVVPLAKVSRCVLDSLPASLKLVCDAVLDSCITDVWGKEIGFAIRDFAGEQLLNAFNWGGASEFKISIEANRIVLEDDGAAFALEQLVQATNGRGGTNAANELLQLGDSLLVSSLRDGKHNVIEVAFVTDAAQVLRSSRCAVEYDSFVMDLEASTTLPEVYLSCETIYIVVPDHLHFIPSVAMQFQKQLGELKMRDRQLVLVGKTISSLVRRMFERDFPNMKILAL